MTSTTEEEISMCQIPAAVAETPASTEPQIFNYFPTLVYTANRPEFLDVVRTVSDEYVEKAKLNHDLNIHNQYLLNICLDLDHF